MFQFIVLHHRVAPIHTYTGPPIREFKHIQTTVQIIVYIYVFMQNIWSWIQMSAGIKTQMDRHLISVLQWHGVLMYPTQGHWKPFKHCCATFFHLCVLMALYVTTAFNPAFSQTPQELPELLWLWWKYRWVGSDLHLHHSDHSATSEGACLWEEKREQPTALKQQDTLELKLWIKRPSLISLHSFCKILLLISVLLVWCGFV